MLAADSLATGHPFAMRSERPTGEGYRRDRTWPGHAGCGTHPGRRRQRSASGFRDAARLITPEVVARLAEQAQVRLQVSTLDTSVSRTDATEAANSPRIVRRETTNEVYRNLVDISANPLSRCGSTCRVR